MNGYFQQQNAFSHNHLNSPFENLEIVINRTIAPLIVNAVDFSLSLKPYEHFVLDNKVPVYLVNAGSQEVAQVELVFYAGNWFEQKNGVAAATNFLLRNGTSSKTALELNEAFEYYGSFCNRQCYSETAIVSLSGLSKHLEKLFPVLADMLSNSVFAEEELAIYKQNSLQKLAVNLKKSEFVAGRLIEEYLYGKDHPYGKNLDAADIENTSREELLEFYNTYYKNGKCVIFVSGRLPGNLKSLLNENFGNLPLSVPDFKPLHAPLSPATEKKINITNDPNGVQGAIRIASLFPNRHHPDFKKASILNVAFGGYFGSRLMANIREEKGYTYGIYSYFVNHLQQSAWMITTEAGKDVCKPTIDEVYKEMKRLQDEPIPAEELSLVKNYMMGSLLGDLDGPFHIMARWKNIILNGLDESYFNDTISNIKNITSEELQTLAKQYLVPENFYELTVV